MLHVEIYTPEKTVYKGNAQAVQLPGESGLFEILSDHAPLISALSSGHIRLTDADEHTHYKIDGGFVEVLKNHVSILIEGLED